MPFPRMTTRRWIFAVALVATPYGGAREGLRLREELRARRAVVERIESQIGWNGARIAELERRIAASKDRQPEEPRFKRWARELAECRTESARYRQHLLKYRRLAAHPWEPFPSPGYDRVYLDQREREYIDRWIDRKGFIAWSAGGAAAALVTVPLATFLAGALTRALRRAARRSWLPVPPDQPPPE